MMIPTPLGIKALGFYGLCWFAYTATPYTNLFFLLLLFQSILLLLGMVLPTRNLRGVGLRLPTEVMGVAGEPLSFELLWNAPEKARAIDFWSLDLPGNGKRKTRRRLASLGKGGERAILTTARLPAQPRGLLPLERFRLRTSYPLGLFRARRTLTHDLHLWVLPRPIDHPILNGATGSTKEGEEGEGGLTSERGLEMAGVREFRPGDDPTKVYWKKSAQRGVLVLREGVEPQGAGDDLFVLDETQVGEAFERQLEALAYLGQRQRRRGESLRLTCRAGELHFGRGGRSWRELDLLLAEVKPEEGRGGE